MAKEAGKNSSDGDVFDLARIRELIDLMEERGLSEVDLRQGEQQVRLARGVAQPVALPAASLPPVAAAPATPPSAAADAEHIKIIASPMVGTFYTKANPKSPDFVTVGSSVSADTVVCIVEAMKVFNEIPAEISGKIVEILASNEEAVDFGRPLFKVDTRG
ncbi:acetyl-CoA carboxylase biotin carboxyl carrier protein [Aureliella helgolandensis]|uniref:Biotin carboxyl carrier protein of acetyl-CoA carboxylase n=1 Tax=Aureliella helgolandensis TaxID=2527968 RepID=A0A518G2Y3_9BACT|nr:acetyl-CoA carboxylase biotin carboxyl carrier protein [Aureliella helgolandensis]QDV22961.1 Acetyl-CoA biotin carboxyl carrier [Aureliella helgolandensis]